MVRTSDWIGAHCAKGAEITAMNVDTQTITFTTLTTGAKAAKELFQVTGQILCTMLGVCTTSLVKSGSATISLGCASDTDLIIANSDPNAIDAGDIWIDETAIGEAEELISSLTWVLISTEDLGYEIKTSTITTGVMDFYVLWYPLSDDAAVVPSGSNTAIA